MFARKNQTPFARRLQREWAARPRTSGLRSTSDSVVPVPAVKRDMCSARRCTVLVLGLLVVLAGVPFISAQTDLDAFMKEVLARRDDNWKKLQQYILDEREHIELRGPNRQPMWGEDREYTWYIRDGYFVRSPVKFNGVTIGDEDRRKYEAEFLERVKRRDERFRQRQHEREASGEATPTPTVPVPEPTVDGLIRQSRQPQFISSAYFLRFRFEQGKYALVGREQLDGRDLLRIEYYPTRLYAEDQQRREATSHDPQDPWDAEMQRLLNKVALITLWVEPNAHQIVRYTFDNIGFDFLPAQWLVQVTSLKASMTMSQPFPDVWLPHDVDVSGSATFAAGPIDVRYSLAYHDYRQADVKTKLRIREDN
jgi:hypothetical protein